MKVLICYYSGSGNTKLACHYIAKKIPEITFDFHDITKDGTTDFSDYGAACFATFADFRGVPFLMSTFIEKLSLPAEMPAFVFTTYGFFSGKMPQCLADLVSARGFDVFAGYSLHTPENYPPMIKMGLGKANAPNTREMRHFEIFISKLRSQLMMLREGKPVDKQPIKMGFLNRLFPVESREKSRRAMGIGEKLLDTSLCNECGICRTVCPYGAVTLDPKPRFDVTRCYGCWACFNHCPKKAIYTRKIRGKAHYPKPNEQLRQKLGG